jgi:hypothetical protein
MIDIRERSTVPPSWASAGIVDARVFSIGESDTVHELTHADPNLVRGKCGVTAHVAERDGRLAIWRDAEVNCPTCKGRS